MQKCKEKKSPKTIAKKQRESSGEENCKPKHILKFLTTVVDSDSDPEHINKKVKITPKYFGKK